MLKLSELLQLKQYKPRYRPTKRFWYFLLIVIAYIIIALLDKPESYFTSNYWQGFL